MFCRTLFEIGDKPFTLFIRLPVFNAAKNDFLFALIVENGYACARSYVDITVIVENLNGIFFRRLFAVKLDSESTFF